MLNQRPYLAIYPNPVDNLLILKNVKKNIKYKLYNLTGQLLLESTYNGDTIDVSNLETGMYLIILSDENDNLSLHARFIKK